MNKLVFALRDSKADTFGNPMFVSNMGVLLRDIQSVITRESSSMLAQHPGDFSLFKLGEFDDVKGVFTLLPLPDYVLDVSSLLQPPRSSAGMPEGHKGGEASVA